MEAVVRPIGRIIFSCVLSGLYQGYLRVHRKTMRSLFVHDDISRQIKRRHRTEKRLFVEMQHGGGRGGGRIEAI